MAVVKASTGLGQPVLIVNAVQAFLVMLCAFGKLDFIGLHGQGDVALLVVVLTTLGGIYTAWSTHGTLLGPLVEFLKAVIAFGVIYGLHVSTQDTGLIIGALTAAFAAFHWNATSPLEQGNFKIAA